MSASWEASYARKMAFFYRDRGLLQHSRADRVAAVKREIGELEAAIKADRAAHEATCETCHKQEQLCMQRFVFNPRRDEMKECLRLLAAEARDEKYVEKSRQSRPEGHCDGFTAYWQNLRYRRFVLADFKCERCDARAEDLHHHHYDTFGFEELDDVQALCRECHRRHHGRSTIAAAYLPQRVESTRAST